MKRGHSAEIPSALLRQLVISHLARLEGRDAMELANEADVHFVDANDNDVSLDSCVVTWSHG